ncbi:alpha/beta fold hydrolase [Cohnella sp.]|uniref:alpha/beta fold hydrolase n=1 Tax=Cohnella sp. TaxID=1883426 RepID=UPI002579CBA6|nr:alpha/beta fold hydrolase [Cohnella sp.]
MKRSLSMLLVLLLAAGLVPLPQARAEIVPYNVVEPIPVLFVHGYSDNGKSWTESEFYNYVQTLGAKVVSVDYGKYSKNDITSAKIDEIYTQAIRKLPPGKFDVVAHSMGGLLTRYYLLKHPEVRERVRRVIFVGTPNHGSPVAFLNRISDMIDDPEDYWPKGKNDPGVRAYRNLYKDYIDQMFDAYDGGMIGKTPFEAWLYEHHPEIIEKIKNGQFTEAGRNLKDLGTPVLPGGEHYRYSEAFEEYAKLIAGRAYEREYRALVYGSLWTSQADDSVSPTRQMIEESFVDEGTKIKEGTKSCAAWSLWLYCKGEENSAKNIVQDRLMYERFDLLHVVDEDGKEIVRENVVANLWLHRLWLDESFYRHLANLRNEYFPQYITIATVDDPGHVMGRWTVDQFIRNLNTWPNEDHDSVVPLSSVKITDWIDKKTSFLDRNVQILPDMRMSKDRDVQRKEGPFIAHSDQMHATDILRAEYENPLTGLDDQDAVLTIDPESPASKTGKIVVVRPNNESLGFAYKLKIKSPVKAAVRILERDAYQTWERMNEVNLVRGDYEGYQGEYAIKTDENVRDYVIVASDPVEVSYEPEGDSAGIGTYPYYVQLLDSTVKGNKAIQTFRVIQRADDDSMGGFDEKDFIFKLNGRIVRNPQLSVTKQTIRSASNVLLALDYSGSMNGLPKLLSMASAEDFMIRLQGKTKAKVGVLGFTDQMKVLSGLTDQYELAGKTVYVELDGGTALYDAVVTGSRMLSGERGKKSMLLLTDGMDEDSEASLEEAIDAAKQANVALYIIGMGDANLDVLQTMANATGGKLMYTYAPDELADLYNTVTEQRDYIYTLQCEAPDGEDSQVLTIEMTQNRSNVAEAAFDFGGIRDSVAGIVAKSKKLWRDLKEAY